MPWSACRNMEEFAKAAIPSKAREADVAQIVDKVCTKLRESPEGKELMKVHNCFRAGSSAKRVALKDADVDLVLYLKPLPLDKVGLYLQVSPGTAARQPWSSFCVQKSFIRRLCCRLFGGLRLSSVFMIN